MLKQRDRVAAACVRRSSGQWAEPGRSGREHRVVLLMRIFFLLVLLAGLALGFGYPFAVDSLAVRDLGKWQLYDNASGYQPVVVSLKRGDAPVRVLVEMSATGQPNRASDSAVLTLTADHDSRTVLAETLTFDEGAAREASPQEQEKVYSDTAGVIGEVDDGNYRFTLGPGDAEGVTVRAANLILRTEKASDARIQPAGFVLTAIGFIGFVLTRRRGGIPPNPNSQPPARRWGRGGSA